MSGLASCLLIVALACAPLAVLALFFGRRFGLLRDRAGERLRLLVSAEPAPPPHRPFEEIAEDLHRLGRRWHALHPHTPYAKVQAVRTAYDRALDECCRALGICHLLGVLAPGPEQDAERERVEYRLCCSGVQLPYAA